MYCVLLNLFLTFSLLGHKKLLKFLIKTLINYPNNCDNCGNEFNILTLTFSVNNKILKGVI